MDGLTDPNRMHILRMAVIAAEEAERIADARKTGRLPSGVGPGISPAPARGAIEVVRPEEVVRTDEGNFRFHRLTGPGEAAIRQADIFDVMEERAARQAKAAKRTYHPLFTEAQKSAGRTYALLFHALAVGAMRCSDFEGEVAGGGQGSVIDALIENARRLKAMTRALDGWALVPGYRRDTNQRRPIAMVTLVHEVAVGEATLSHMLRRYRWPETNRNYRLQLREALCAGLDRLYGL